MSGVAIVDSGANYASVCGALARLGADFTITGDARELRRAERVILPGVGHVGDALARLEAQGLSDVIRSLRQPLLGICVGMQVLFEHCEEAGREGLGLFAGSVTRLPVAPGVRVPHCGWNELELRRDCALTASFDQDARPWAYFVHSFAAPTGDATVATSDHGGEFSAIVAMDNVFGVQFHPERSARAGRDLLAAFLAL